jgi:hypothetical protein
VYLRRLGLELPASLKEQLLQRLGAFALDESQELRRSD